MNCCKMQHHNPSCVSLPSLFPLYLRRVPSDKPGVTRRGEEMTPAGKGSRLLPEGAAVAAAVSGVSLVSLWCLSGVSLLSLVPLVPLWPVCPRCSVHGLVFLL
ncbi:unnamed protein product [Gadus morhua 'NCC']